MSGRVDKPRWRRVKRAARAAASWLRSHRRSLRIIASGLAILAFVTIALLLFAFWTEHLPPYATPTSSATASASPPSTPAEPVIVARVPSGIWWGLVGAVACGALVRWLITDRRLNRLRQLAGDPSIVTDRRSTEDTLLDDVRRASTRAARTEARARLTHYLRRRRQSLVDQSSEALAVLASSIHAEPGEEQKAPRRRIFSRTRASQPVYPSRYLAATMQALVSPPTVFTRVSERRTLGAERADVSLTRTVGGAAGNEDLVLVPVLRFPRGTVLGAISVTIDGKPARTLPTSVARGLLVRMLRLLTASATREAVPAVRDRLRDLVPFVLSTAASDLPVSAARRRAWLRLFDRYAALDSDRTDDVRFLRALAEISLAADVVFAVVPGGCRQATRISIEYQEPYAQPVKTLVGWIRRIVGIGITDFSLLLDRAAESRSYHLDVRAGDTTYVEEADVVLPPGWDEGAPSQRGGMAELIQVSPLRGDAHAHLYWRDFDAARAPLAERRRRTGISTPEFRIRIRERPPGLIGATSALSLWIVLITWGVGYFYPVLFAGGSMSNSAWATLILGAPALVTGWLLSRLTAESMRSMSISAFALIVWLSINIAGVVAVVALAANGAQVADVALTPAVTVHHLGWLMLMASTGLHVCASGLLLFGRGVRYARTINEGVGA